MPAWLCGNPARRRRHRQDERWKAFTHAAGVWFVPSYHFSFPAKIAEDCKRVRRTVLFRDGTPFDFATERGKSET